MVIRRICIRNFRKLRAPVVIDGLGPGLTVIAGENEEGKSTVLAAVQAAFFNRHRLTGDAALAMQPLGAAGLRPEITVAFELEGKPYTLTKAFCQSPSAELVAPDGRWSGDAAEERLKDLLGFDLPGRGAARPEHLGVWGLFWVEQGTAFARPELTPQGRKTVDAALEKEVGQVLGGSRGAALLAAIQSRYESLFTPKTGKAAGEYKKAFEEVARLAAERDDLARRLSEYEEKTQALARLREESRQSAKDGRLAQAKRALHEAEARADALQALERALKDAETEEKLARAARQAAQAASAARRERIAERDRLTQRHAEFVQARGEKANALAAAETVRAEWQKAFDAKKTALEAAQAELEAADRALARARAAADLTRLQERLQKAEAAERERDRLRAEGQAIGIDEAVVDALRRLNEEAAQARIRLEAIATRVEFVPEGSRRVTRDDGVPVKTDTPLNLTEPARFTLEGFGKLFIQPGGEDLAALRQAADRSRRALAEALRRAGVTSPDEAEAKHKRRAESLSRARERHATVAAEAPDGVAALRSETERKAAELAELSRDATALSAGVVDAERAREAALQQREVAKAACAAAEVDLRRAEATHTEAREAWLTADANERNATQQVQAAEQALAADRGSASDEAVDANLRSAVARHQEALEALKACQGAVAAANPEEVQRDLAARREALRTLEEHIKRTNDRILALEGELRGLGQGGLGEQLAETEGALARARARALRLEREAKATKLLLETLTEAEREAKAAFLEPVVERLRPYLKALFATGEVRLTQPHLAVSHLRQDGIDVPFEALSLGTREQLSVLVRIAFAEFLRDNAKPAALILDEALAYADDPRFRRMGQVLHRAAQRLQILLLTCRERDYHDFGWPIIRLADCRQG
jgi:uncharacterized protein YhaN